MSLTEKQIESIDYMIQHELKLKEMYLLFAEKFPELKDFFISIANEEEGHANAIRSLFGDLRNEKVFYDENRFKVPAIKFSLQYISDVMQLGLSGKLNSLHALGICHDIEKGLIDNRFFEVFKTDDNLLKSVLKTLKEGTEVHAKKIKKKMEELK